MALNLVRNSRVFFTTDVGATDGKVDIGALESDKTFEIQVLEGLTFSQNTNQETVTINEAGSSPVRGQRSFNTSLAPVDFSMSTYMRPRKKTTTGQTPTTTIEAEESVLWAALSSVTGNGWSTTATNGAVNFDASNAHQLQKFGLIIILDNVTYVIDDCVLTQATIDFGIDAISTIAWTGQGKELRKLDTNGTASAGAFGGGLTGAYTEKNTTAPFIANKLSTATVTKSGVTYQVAITGGSLTINNNVTYLVPANLAVVNKPATYFTGTRAISGSLTAYLKTGGTTDTGALLASLLSDTTNVEPKFALNVAIGGSSNGNRVVLDMPTSMLTIPTIDVQQVVSTTINFTAQGATSSAYDIAAVNELTVKYYAA
jgi:hypothetical protein